MEARGPTARPDIRALDTQRATEQPEPAPRSEVRYAQAVRPGLLTGPQTAPATTAALTPPRITAANAQPRWPATVPGNARYNLLDYQRSLFRVDSPALGAGAHVTYAIADKPMATRGELGSCRDIESFERLAARSNLDVGALHREIDGAMTHWARHANITVERIDDPARATFVFGAMVDPSVAPAAPNIAWTRLDVAPPVNGVSEVRQAAFCFNPERNWVVNGASTREVMSFRRSARHEVGHGFGLDHQNETVMGHGEDEPEDVTPGDISGLQRIYGPPAL